ncbi:MAG: PQQ-binding-like beta-propeller repeat protein [Lyngbya sp. HA4199-MV5]|jgi:polyvinyl alcohol dehydrogenase (cytochrome)|nr:PQQ-binding-like beta-propeller repeat protein [Lyngbya sp. HA4199-MV5]
MRLWKLHPWKTVLLGGTIALLGWLGWRYADQRKPTLLALNTTTGKLQWVQPLAPDIGYSKGPIVGDGKVFLGACVDDAVKGFSAYRLQAFDAQSGRFLWALQPQRTTIPYDLASNEAVSIQDGQLYLQLENELQAIDPATGKQRWAIPRRWFFAPVNVWYGIGLISRPNALVVLNSNGKERVLQTLDPKTGKVLKQIPRSLGKLTTTRNLITADDRTLFLETSGLVPADSPNTFLDSGISTITAYDIKTLQTRFRAITGNIVHLQAVGDALQLSTNLNYDPKTRKLSDGKILAVSAESGQLLWQKTKHQLQCPGSYFKQIDNDTVYLNCSGYPGTVSRNEQNSRVVVAVSAQTGDVKWQARISPNRYSDNLPAAVNAHQYLTFRNVLKSNVSQTQAIALDRQTGKLLWTFPLFDPEARYVDTWQSIVAAEGDRFFTLDVLPRWQLWLLQMNRHWYVKQAL